MRFWQKIVRPLAWVVLVLLIARIGLRAAIDSATKPAGTSGAVPAAQFQPPTREVVVREDDAEIAALFHVRNAGQRRLVVSQLRRACCDPAGPEPLILEAGASGHVSVETTAAELLAKGEFRQGFTTNDPRLPEVWLTLKLANQPTRATDPTPVVRPGPAAVPPASRSVLVKRP